MFKKLTTKTVAIIAVLTLVIMIPLTMVFARQAEDAGFDFTGLASETTESSGSTSGSDLFGSDYDDMVTAALAGLSAYYTVVDSEDLTGSVQTIFAFGMYLIELAYGVALVLTSVVLIWSIIRYALAGGKPKAKEEAKHAIMIGLIILAILGALPLIYMIIVSVLNVLGG